MNESVMIAAAVNPSQSVEHILAGSFFVVFPEINKKKTYKFILISLTWPPGE